MIGWIFIICFCLVYFLLSRKTYTYSGWFPQSIRRGWIKWKHPEDYYSWPEFEGILVSEFPFYRILQKKEKSEFLVRTTDLMNRMPLEGREGVEIDQRKRLLLNASLAQITFGFSHYRFFGFEKIIVYPHTFYSKFLDAEVKGVTYGSGYIFLSWQDFEEGYNDDADKLNLGLHEFAHALMLEKNKHFDSPEYDNFIRMGNFLMKQKEESGQSDPLFRDYGLSNHNELWAVCVEVFFEKPLDFKETYPNLYRVISDMLQQDMAKRTTAYLMRGAA